MQQVSMLKASRLPGALRYFTRKVVNVVGVLVIVALCVTILNFAICIFAGVEGAVNTLSMLFNANGIMVIMLCAQAAYGESRYLAITPMPRFSIFLGVLWKMVCFALLSSLVACLYSGFEALLAQAITATGIANIRVAVREMDLISEMMSSTAVGAVATDAGSVLMIALGRLPATVIRLVEYSGVWYLYLCLLRRWKMQTLLVTIGAPILLATMVLVPVINGWADAILSMSQNEMMQALPVLYDILNTLADIARWMIEEMALVEAITGALCWLIAYPVMRGTPQPS